MDPFGAGAALHWLAPPGHISSAHRARKDGIRVGMSVTAYQEKEKNEETKKGRRKEKEKTGDQFCKSCVLPYCGRSGRSIAKKWRGVPGVSGTLGKANSHFDPTQTGSGTAPPRWGGCWLVQGRGISLCALTKSITRELTWFFWTSHLCWAPCRKAVGWRFYKACGTIGLGLNCLHSKRRMLYSLHHWGSRRQLLNGQFYVISDTTNRLPIDNLQIRCFVYSIDELVCPSGCNKTRTVTLSSSSQCICNVVKTRLDGNSFAAVQAYSKALFNLWYNVTGETRSNCVTKKPKQSIRNYFRPNALHLKWAFYHQSQFTIFCFDGSKFCAK